MTVELALAFASFAFVSSITPGPNNAMVLASGVNYGFRRTIPHILGVAVGAIVMLLLVGLGLGRIFAAVPMLYDVLRYAGAAYLLWLAWKIARAGPITVAAGASRPLTLAQAAAFQWINPKAWIIVVGAVSTYAPREGFAANVAVLASLFAAMALPCLCLWAGGGTALRPLMTHPGRARAFNVAMALLLVASLVPILE